jgi:hypothetical protein
LARELARLGDERRHHDESDGGHDRENPEVDDQDREPARDPGPDRQERLALDQADERPEPDREEDAHVDEDEYLARKIERPAGEDHGDDEPDGPGDELPRTVLLVVHAAPLSWRGADSAPRTSPVC